MLIIFSMNSVNYYMEGNYISSTLVITHMIRFMVINIESCFTCISTIAGGSKYIFFVLAIVDEVNSSNPDTHLF